MAEQVLFTEENKTHVLSIAVSHSSSNGTYRLSVNKNIDETNAEGITWRTFVPFADGNFNCTLARGRKSQAKLDKANTVIKENMAQYTELWNNGEYQKLANVISGELAARKIIL